MKIDLKNKKIGRFKIEELDDSKLEFIGCINFKNKSQLKKFYHDASKSKETFLTNFGGDPYNSASYIKLKKDGLVVTLDSPRTNVNSDTNWNSYEDDHGFFCLVKIQKAI